MQKDISRLREIDTQEERERIAAIKTEGEKAGEPETKITPPAQPAEPLVFKPLKRLLPPKKLWIRLAIVFSVALIAGSLYWIFVISRQPDKEPPPPVAPTPPSAQVPASPATSTPPEIIIPPSLVQVEKTENFDISKTEDLPNVLADAAKEGVTENSFVRIIVKNTTENRLVLPQEIAQAFQVEAPEGFFDSLGEDFTLLSYVQKEGRRPVLIAKIKDKTGLNNALKGWEAKIAKDGVFLSGAKIQALVSYFKTGKYKNTPVRYLTISKQDMGVCYVIFGDYFVLTASFAGLKAAVDRIESAKLTQ